MSKFKRYLFWSTIFVFGFISGSLATSLLVKNVLPTYVSIIQSGLSSEQGFLAAKAAREDRMFEAAVHRWAAVNAEAEDGFRIFRKDQTYYDNGSIFFPLRLLIFKNMFSTDNIVKGQKIIEGINRGKLASALENIGENELAKEEWEKAQKLQGNRPIEKLRESVQLLLEQEKTDLHLSAEKVVLGTNNSSPNKSQERTE